MFVSLNIIIDEVVQMRLVGEQEMIYVEQGNTFSFDIECVDKDGNVVDFGKFILLLSNEY